MCNSLVFDMVIKISSSGVKLTGQRTSFLVGRLIVVLGLLRMRHLDSLLSLSTAPPCLDSPDFHRLVMSVSKRRMSP